MSMHVQHAMKSASAVSCSSCSYCDAVDLGGTRYLVPRLGTRRLVLGTAAAAMCVKTAEHESQGGHGNDQRVNSLTQLIADS